MVTCRCGIFAALVLLLAAVSAQAAPVRDLKPNVNDARPTWAFVCWEPVAGADGYQLWYQPTRPRAGRVRLSADASARSALLTNLRPDADYRVQITATGSGKPSVLGRGELTFTTPPEAPKAWEDMDLWRSRELVTLGATTWPAIATVGKQLFLFEVYEGGIYATELGDKGQATGAPGVLVGGVEGVGRTCLSACTLKDTIWLAWVERSGGSSAMVMVSWKPDQTTPLQPLEIARAKWGSVAPYGDRLWLIWQPDIPGAPPIVAAPFDVGAGTQPSVTWTEAPPTAGQPTVTPFLSRMAVAFTAEEGGQQSLFTATFNGVNFTGPRVIRRAGNNSDPRAAVLADFLYVVYSSDAHYPTAQGAYCDLAVTQVGPDGFALSSTLLDSDGMFNTSPALATSSDALWVVYNKWSENPQSNPDAQNYGTFLARLALPPLAAPIVHPPAPQTTTDTPVPSVPVITSPAVVKPTD